MNSETNKNNPDELVDSGDRRKLLGKFGKFAAYAAPFTVLAFAKKADAATGTGPGKHVRPK